MEKPIYLLRGYRFFYRPSRIMIMDKRISAALIAAVFILFPVKAPAYRLGDVDVKLRAGVAELYDDNITYAKTNKESDFITRPTLGISAVYEGKTIAFSAAGNIYHEFFSNNSDFNNNSEDVALVLRSELSKYERLTIKDAFSHTYEPRSFEDQFGRTGGRYSSYRNRLNLGYSRDITKVFGIAVRCLNEYNDYSRKDIPESFLNSAGLEGAYAVASDLSLLAAYDFFRRNFDPGQAASTNTVSGGIRKYFTKQVYLDAMGGADFISSYNNTDYTKPHISVSLTDDIDEKTSASLSFSKRYNTISYSQDLFNEWRISAALKKQLTGRVGCSASAFYGRGEYVAATVVNKLTGSRVGLSYDIRDNWQGNISYSFSKEDSSAAGGGYRKNTVTVGITGAF